MQRAVVFDLGGVLIDWDPRYLYRKLFDDADEMEWFLANVVTREWNARQDVGRPFHDAIEELVVRHPGHAPLIRAYLERWPEMLGGPITENVGILADLRAAGVPLYALTNWSAETFPLARATFEFLGWFRGIVVSGEELIGKPDPRIFRALLARFDLEPELVVFVDDLPDNVEQARRLGMDAIRYTTPHELRQALRELGLLERSAGDAVPVGRALDPDTGGPSGAYPQMVQQQPDPERRGH